MADELWQACDEQGKPVFDSGITKADAARGTLHGAVHVWLWRKRNGEIELLLQRRSLSTSTWPGCLDISAAGHIDFGEKPLAAALRETKEELGLAFRPTDLHPVGIFRTTLHVPGRDIIENEVQWIYLVEAMDSMLKLERDEVSAAIWKTPADLRAELADATAAQQYVPHGPTYFETIFAAVNRVTG